MKSKKWQEEQEDILKTQEEKKKMYEERIAALDKEYEENPILYIRNILKREILGNCQELKTIFYYSGRIEPVIERYNPSLRLLFDIEKFLYEKKNSGSENADKNGNQD